jgi:hypothetical protein
MNIDRSTPPEADLSPADPDRGQAASGLGSDDAPDPARLMRRSGGLDRMGDIGVELAEELVPLARAQGRLADAVTELLRRARPDGVVALGELAVLLHQGAADFALMYERISRSVRRCIMLKWHFATPHPARASAGSGRGSAAGGAKANASAGPAAQAGAGRARDSGSQTDTESGIAAELGRELRPERFDSDLYDRPEDLTGMADLGLDRPMAELVAEICTDFGVDGRVWAERLGIQLEPTDGLAPDSPRTRSNTRQTRLKRGGRAETSAANGPPKAAPPARSNGPPGPSSGADRPGRCSPLAAADPGIPIALNRRERRAARKLGLKLARSAPKSANLARSDSGRGPP